MGTLKTPRTERLEVEMEPILWPDIVEPFAVQILRGCCAGLSSENTSEVSCNCNHKIHKLRGRRHTRQSWERRGIRCITNHMNDISDDVFKVICGNGESGSWRFRLCRDESHWLDTLCVSNSSSRNWNTWFVAMIASLNIVAKTFAKIAKTFVGLSTMIIATKRRHVFILHLEAKYTKTDSKNEIYAKNWVRNT